MTIIRTATTAKGGVTPEELLQMHKHRQYRRISIPMAAAVSPAQH